MEAEEAHSPPWVNPNPDPTPTPSRYQEKPITDLLLPFLTLSCHIHKISEKAWDVNILPSHFAELL